MLTREENEQLTVAGPGTCMGTLLRRFWVPFLFSSDLPEPDCPPRRVRIMNEDLVAFRDSNGHVGLLDQRCPHRGASLFFGRNEECGLRCVYHGWKFDVAGNCVDMPNEPAESNFKHKIKQAAYPCQERTGIIWAYMGPAELKPAMPELEWMQVPSTHVHFTKRLQECNWLQAMEGGFDVSHLQFLHRGDLRGPEFEPRATDPVIPKEQQVALTDCGLVVGYRGDDLPDGRSSWSCHQFLMPWFKGFSLRPNINLIAGHMWVPIDDQNCLLWSFEYVPDRPLSDPALQWSANSLNAETVPGSERTVRNRDNDYLIDRQLQSSGRSFTGITGVGQQDSAIQESMGPILDRSREHLGTADISIITLRRVLQRALTDLETGAPIQGFDACAQQLRSVAIELPAGVSFADAGYEQLKERSGMLAAAAA